MNYDLHKPCSGCPFLKQGGVKFLGRRRAQEIAFAMTSSQGSTFACHKTVQFDEEGEHMRTPGEQHCAGALLFMEKVNPGGNQMSRIAERIGVYKPDQYAGAELVFDTVKEMVRAHEDERRD